MRFPLALVLVRQPFLGDGGQWVCETLVGSDGGLSSVGEGAVEAPGVDLVPKTSTIACR